jgi:Flp pilus assembly protein TadB
MARRGTLRASDEDRERVIERLHRASTEGRIAAHELEQRVAAALKAITYSELDATTADLPSAGRNAKRHGSSQRALSTVREHPAVLIAAIPVIMVVIALLLALTLLWLVGTVAVLALGQRRRALPPPWSLVARHRLGGPVRRRGARGGWA